MYACILEHQNSFISQIHLHLNVISQRFINQAVSKVFNIKNIMLGSPKKIISLKHINIKRTIENMIKTFFKC